MTIHQTPGRCWFLDPHPDEESDPHYETWAEADEALRTLRKEYGPDPADLAEIEAVRVRQFQAPCWVAECDGPDGPEGTCGETLGDEEEGPSCVHFGTLEELLAWLPSEGWTRVGADRALCRAGSDSISEPPPLSPAELEAAGQMRLPGVA